MARFILVLFTIVAFAASLSNARPHKTCRGSSASSDISNAIGNIMEAVVNLFEGTATFFHPVSEGGPIGSCGEREDDNSDIVALNTDQYGDTRKKSDWCFKKVLIKHKNKYVVARINDACPGCSRNSLDLTPVIFRKLADPDLGRIPISWCVIGDGNCRVPSSGDEGDECT